MALTFAVVADRLTPEAEQLFTEMVEAHLASAGDRLFLLSETMAGNSLMFTGKPRRDWRRVDKGALEDLARYGLLTRGRSGRTHNFRVNGDGVKFHEWFVRQSGQAVAQVENAAARLLASETFGRRFPGAKHHLDEASKLLWHGNTDDQTASEIGDHLRKALMDLTSVIVGDDGGRSEKPVERLEAHLAAADVSERERTVLVDLVGLARSCLRLDHRLNHVRDETDKELPLRGWDEARRAVSVTTLVCAELAIALP